VKDVNLAIAGGEGTNGFVGEVEEIV